MNEPTVLTTTNAAATTAAPVPGAPADAPNNAAAATPRTASNAAPARRTKRWRLWVVAAILVGAFALLLVEGLGSSLNYFETVDQALAHKTMLGSQTFRLEGVVVPGTVHRIPDGVAFVASGTKHRVDVVNHGNPPQLFQPDIPVVVVGHFSGSSFISDQLIVDHTAQYTQAHPNRVRAPNGTAR
jgi:cytochrome c-type biogenesis protein CcmE